MARMLLGAVICSLFVAAQCMYSPTDDVVTLTPSNFQKEVLQSDSLWLVEFYAPWCGHCQRLTPEWKKAASALKGVVKIGAVDCDEHKALGGQYQIPGYPTIKVFGANKNKPQDYQGGRTSEAIVDTALSALRSLVKDRLSGRAGAGGSDSGKEQEEQEPQQEEQEPQQEEQEPQQEEQELQQEQQDEEPQQPHYAKGWQKGHRKQHQNCHKQRGGGGGGGGGGGDHQQQGRRRNRQGGGCHRRQKNGHHNRKGGGRGQQNGHRPQYEEE